LTATLWQHEAAFIELIAKIKHNGIKVDKQFCREKIAIGEPILFNIKQEVGFNPGSPKQLGDFLLGEMGYPVVKRNPKTGNPSFDKYAMEEYELLLEADGSDLASKILTYRGWSKTISSNYRSYLDLADREGILHPNYKVHGTRTCRTSCENPNLQQIPRSGSKPWNGDVKQGFIPRADTVLVDFDYSQIETRLAAAVAGEQELLDAFWAGIDVFNVMAERLGWERQDCKTLTYATLYGAGVNRIALIFKISKKDARDRIDEFFDSYPKLKEKAKDAQRIAKASGFITYWTGRRRHFDDGDYHKAFNAYVQGGAFEIIKRSGVRLAETITYPIVLTVHDSYVLELPREEFTDENCQRIKSILEDVPETNEMGVPFRVGYKVWGAQD
jgi:DNA polymerase I